MDGFFADYGCTYCQFRGISVDGFCADYDCTPLLVSNTSAVLAADDGIAKMCTELAAIASSEGSLWMVSSPIMVVRSCGCLTPVLYWQLMLALPRCLMSWHPLPV